MPVVALLLAFACGGGNAKRLKIYAAASLRDAISELATRYGERHGVEPVLNFASSGLLAIQVEHGGFADVFISAGDKEMDRLARNGRINAGTRRVLLSNQLVVVVPTGGHPVSGPSDLKGDWLTLLSLANTKSVPAGRYAKAWLEEVGLWEHLKDRHLPGVDVRAALSAVEYGGAEAGIVYRTDAAISEEIEVAYTIPLEEGPQITYPVACLSDSKHQAEALSFLRFLEEPESKAVFERYGFLVRHR